MEFYLILYKTDRLILRPLTSDDVGTFKNYLNKNREFLRPWEPERGEDYYKSENLLSLISDQGNSNNNRTGLSVGIFLADTNGLIGQIAVSNIVYGPFLSCFLGYKLDKDQVGLGYMSEALTEIVKVCFNEYGLHRIEANIIPSNIRSESVLKKLDFINEGLSIKYLKIAGKWQDHYHYVLLNSSIE